MLFRSICYREYCSSYKKKIRRIRWKCSRNRSSNKYKRIKGRIAVADDSEKATGQFTIYGDNGKILYNSGEMSRTTAPIDVDVDISGAQWITVGVTNPDWGYFRLLVSDFVLYK